jgi:hypothetical protein
VAGSQRFGRELVAAWRVMRGDSFGLGSLSLRPNTVCLAGCLSVSRLRVLEKDQVGEARRLMLFLTIVSIKSVLGAALPGPLQPTAPLAAYESRVRLFGLSWLGY